MSEVEITQADREAAARFYGKYLALPGEVPVEAAFRSGHVDESPLIQAFAQRASQARADALEESAKVAEERYDNRWNGLCIRAAQGIAAAIRSLANNHDERGR